MISTIKQITYDFLENERSVFGEVRTKIEYEDQSVQDFTSTTLETLNTEIINREEAKSESHCPGSSEICISVDNRTEYSGATPKRYITKCYLAPKTIPYWYNESVLLFINSTKKVYAEKVYFKDKMLPFRWSEKTWIELGHQEHPIQISSVDIPVTDVYIPLKVVA